MLPHLKPPFKTAIDLMQAADKVYLHEEARRLASRSLPWPAPDVSGSMTHGDHTINAAAQLMDRQVAQIFRNSNRLMAQTGARMDDVRRRMEAIQRQTLSSLDRRDGYTLPTTPVQTKPALVVASTVMLLALAGTILAALLL